jgi:2-oxo-4-hydroxy-4-carboxy--5-ureidoimidazoline (OHCU) decarboxylase
VADVVEVGRKSLADKIATATPPPTETEKDAKTGRFVRTDKTKNISTEANYGTSSEYRLGKIKRDHPELAERIIAGEFKSVSEAERAVGLRPPLLTDYEKTQRAFLRLTEEDQERFRNWLKELSDEN